MGFRDVSKEDRIGLGIVLGLYVLQGVPLGLTMCVPMVLQVTKFRNKIFSYKGPVPGKKEENVFSGTGSFNLKFR